MCDNLQLGTLRTQRAVTSTGRPLAELMQWPLGALHAIAGREPGQRALHKWGGELSLLPMLLMGEAPAKRAAAIEPYPLTLGLSLTLPYPYP